MTTLMKNVVLVIDTRNIMACLGMTFGNGKLNYQKYIQDAVGNDILYAGIAYGCTQNGNESRFISSLKHMGLDAKFKAPLTKINHDTKEVVPRWVNWNVGMTLDVVKLTGTSKVDKVIIGSSDPELVDLVEYLKGNNIKVEIFACGVPKVLKNAASGYKEITDKYLYEAPPKQSVPATVEVPTGPDSTSI